MFTYTCIRTHIYISIYAYMYLYTRYVRLYEVNNYCYLSLCSLCGMCAGVGIAVSRLPKKVYVDSISAHFMLLYPFVSISVLTFQNF
jgi:hypothetical protein